MRKAFLLPGCAAIILSAVAITLTNCGNNMKIKTMPYPDTRMDTTVVDDYHGTKVADPYRWLEDDNSDETAEWVKAENEVTFDYLGQIPYREDVKNRLTELWNYAKEGAPSKHGDWYYFSKNDGLQNQNVIYRQRSLDSEPEIFLDPNTLSADGTVALSTISFSEDGKYFAYSVAESGSDWTEIRVMDTETREVFPDLIKWVKFSAAVWSADSKGFYYSRYDEPRGSAYSGKNEYQKVFYHRLGDAQQTDKLIYTDPAHPLRYFAGVESSDGKYVFVNASDGTYGEEFLYREKGSDAPFKVLLPGFANDHIFVECDGGTAYFHTNLDAPNYKLIAIDMTDPSHKITDIIPENKDMLLQDVSVTGGYLMAKYLENAQSAVCQFDMQGRLVRRVELPGIGTVDGFGRKKETVETFYSLSAMTAPPTVYKYDLATGTSEIFRKPEVSFDPELYTTDQVFFTSKDGTQVPMFILHRKDMKLDGNNPLLMYGYGGFNINYTPSFNPSNIMFLEQGGIYVLVTLRGGGEYGEKWHKAGMLENKQNVFDDFIAAAEYLIDNKYTSSKKLAITGGSNGGLLIGACMTQRPELFAVAIPQVGVLDMLRYQLFTIGWGWVVEYGSSDSAEQFEYIYKYSPLHNIKPGTCYPATMITTGDHDDRVVPAHSFKFAATLQKAQGCDKPALIRIDTNAGHGAGKPTAKRIEEATDIYSFILWNTDTKTDFGKK